MSRRNLRGFNFERLENRRLLAADFGAEVIQCDFLPPETCEVSTVVEVEETELESEIDIDELVSRSPDKIQTRSSCLLVRYQEDVLPVSGYAHAQRLLEVPLVG